MNNTPKWKAANCGDMYQIIATDPTENCWEPEEEGGEPEQWNIAVVEGADMDKNAPLIAAAPELLEAVEFVVSAIENWEWENGKDEHGFNMMKEAIKKAKGQ